MMIGALSVVLLHLGLPAWAGSYGSFIGVMFHSCYDGDTCSFTIPGVHPLLGDSIKVRLRGGRRRGGTEQV